mgnify:FL=1|jgi:hypothetical protein
MSLDIECKPNSHKAKQEAATKKGTPKVKKVVSGTVKTKKKKGVSKLKEALIADSAKDVGSHAFLDVLIPAMKKAFSDIVKDGVDMILYGETRGRKSSSNASYVSYRTYSDRDRDRRDDRRSSNSIFNLDDIILESRADADDVLDAMSDLIETYESVSVADLYDLIGIDVSGRYTYNDYGWTSLRNAEIVEVHEGYWIKLPRPRPIK